MILKLPLFVTGVALLVVILTATFTFAPTANAQKIEKSTEPTISRMLQIASADFRVIAVSEHDGQLLIEVEHFKPDGSFDYFENYLWQGREGTIFPRKVDANNRLLLANGNVAPFKATTYGIAARQYLPQGHTWKREESPALDTNSILAIIQSSHNERVDWIATDWPGNKKRGQSRLIEKNIIPSNKDLIGVPVLLQKFQGLASTAYLTVKSGTLKRYNGTLPKVNPGLGLIEYGTISTFYPDASSVDGYALQQDFSGSVNWATLRGGAGNGSSDSSPSAFVHVLIHAGGAGTWARISRIQSGFDTSSIGTDTVTAATYGFVVDNTDGVIANSFNDSLSLVLTTPASDTAIVNGDYAQFGTTLQATNITVASINGDESTYNNLTLNSTGLGNINGSGITNFGLRATSDATNSEPAWIAYGKTVVGYATTDETLPGDVRPRLVVTHLHPAAAVTGTIGDGATEQEVRDGNGTILVTLTDDTWVASGATFDAQRQNIINGLVAADSQTYGWNNEVKAKLGVTAVVRTSDTLVTITIPAGDVADYRIVTNEVITTTVPATAIGGAALVATPTTTITGTVESAAVSGTLGGSGGTAPEIVAGGETVIITLTNTAWVTAGATFNAQRQNILDGLVADDSDVNGWNAMAFAVGDVVRTSGTIVTITLSAESGYAIPSAETVTTTVPASAIVYAASLVAPETFTISPAAFATSGTRVSTAINLSGVTDLAYCAIGWETTLPTNTAVAIETSVDGGASYSTATNGNCPTGLTLGESLASITDFRVKATLSTTDTAATPLITALGLIVEDATGSELCYQLLTTPSASLPDNCGTYTGTMSYPLGPSTITSSTASITSTAESLPNTRSLAGQDVAQAVTGSATSASLFPNANQGGGFTGLPLNDLVNEMSTVGDGLPVRFVWFIFLGIATIGAGMMAVHLTSNLFIAAGAMAAVMGFQMAIGTTGLLPGWILFAFIPLAAAYLLFRRGFPA